MRKGRASALFAAATVAVAGCGGGSESDKVKSSVQDYVKAIVDGNGAKACERLSAATKQSYQRASKQQCPALFTKLSKDPRIAGVKPKLRSATVSSVKVTGKTASATVAVKGQPASPVNLTKEGSEWKIQNAIGG